MQANRQRRAGDGNGSFIAPSSTFILQDSLQDLGSEGVFRPFFISPSGS